MKRSLVGIVVLAILCTLSGCADVAEEAAERAIEGEIGGNGGQADVEIGDESFSIQVKGKGGDSSLNIGAGAKIPDGFPDDVPIYENMTILMAQSQTQKETFVVHANSTDSMLTVAGSYQQQAEKNGWEEESDITQGGKVKVLTYKKGDRSLQITLVAEDEGTQVNLVTSKG
jgi:hypothetical protein